MEPVEIRLALPDGALPEPLHLDLWDGPYPRKTAEAFKAGYPEVFRIFEKVLEAAGLPSVHEYWGRQQEIGEAPFLVASEQDFIMQRLEYDYWPSLPGRFGPDGSLYLSGMGTSEVHCLPPGAGRIEANYFVGTAGEFRNPQWLSVDPHGLVHVLDYARERGWIVHRFDAPASYTDIPLDPRYGRRLRVLQAGISIPISSISAGITLHKFSSDGAWLDSMDLNPLDLLRLSSVWRLAHVCHGWA